MSKEKQVFVPKARLIQILGEHLIKDATVGVLELIKNSYDADATEVTITMINLNSNNAKIIIEDNGCGMDTNTFLNKWMNPASGHKQVQKEDQIRTALNRMPLGEKGVGRFASQQIGNHLLMITKVKKSMEELYVDIDWARFEDHNMNLDDIFVEYELKKANRFIQLKQSGTILEISSLKSNWGLEDIARIANALKRMKSPFKGASDFNITLKFENCPEDFEKFQKIESSDILEKAHYKIWGTIDSKGVFDFEYDYNYPGEEQKHRASKFDLTTYFGNVPKIINEFDCGGFFVYLHHYNKKLAPKSGFAKKDIDELCGVSVFRDGIRILPYGEKGNDWLDLDKKRIQDTDAISNDTIIGMIEINQTENYSLKDKTNREGLIENESYYEFRQLVISAVQYLKHERDMDKPLKQSKNPEENYEKVFNDINLKLKSFTNKMTASQESDIIEAIPLLNNIITNVESIKKKMDEETLENEEVNKRLSNLAGTGLAAERFTHEFAKLVNGAIMSLERLKKLVDMDRSRVKKEMDVIYSVLEALKNDIRLLGPMFYIKKVAKEKVLDLKQIIANTLCLQQHWVDKESIVIDVIGDSFEIKMREGSCMQVFNNLIDNSIYWLTKKTETDKRKIRIIIDKENDSVFISDNGPGIAERFKEKIFDPFFSMKGEEGRGLGLYIVKEILEEKKWNIELADKNDYDGLLKGASFKITFSKNNA